MRIAFCLYKYFPFGGMQRDFMSFLREAIGRGHQCRVYCMRWQGPKPDGVEVRMLPRKGLSNHRQAKHFTANLQRELSREPVDVIFGFNKMPGLDLYYAADSCYEDKARTQRGSWYRLSPRYRHYAAYERAVFACGASSKILLISNTEQVKFQHYYKTEAERLIMLPPGISRDRCAPDNAEELRQRKRKAMGVEDDHTALMFVGSGFVKKGLDRAIKAVASLPEQSRLGTTLYVVGQDREKPFRKLATSLGVIKQIKFLGGRDDIPQLLLMADALIHPAYDEAAGIVLLEALVAGLPVVVTDVCGYACHIEKADSGIVLSSPFDQRQLNQIVGTKITSENCARWKNNALIYAAREDLYSMHATGIDYLESCFQQHSPSCEIAS